MTPLSRILEMELAYSLSAGVFILTLLPAVYEKLQRYFFQIPDHFLNYVNTTLVPILGYNGGILVLNAAKFIVLLLKTQGQLIIFVGRQIVAVVSGAKASLVNGFFQVAGIFLLLNLLILVLNRIFKAILKKLV